ncbi:hypothetical protein [Compostibacter hankyongensis]|uniref:Uncharacterized protein n=1 Tax=Compostibacter hankyongensis TaxID=1007089 RepID=A0ABP8FTM4_9BACT
MKTFTNSAAGTRLQLKKRAVIKVTNKKLLEMQNFAGEERVAGGQASRPTTEITFWPTTITSLY